jgi:adenosylcobinamide-GDP ribazoletransferase
VALTALRGAFGFLSRLPVGHDRDAWEQFIQSPITFPISGMLIGSILSIPFVVAGTLPAPTIAVAYLGLIALVTGVNHIDGLADLGDAAAVHGPPETRREVMRDTTVGVGAVFAVGTILVGLGFGAVAVAGLAPVSAVIIVIASETSAKLAMATLACFGTPSHEGFGSTLTDGNEPRGMIPSLAVSVPVAALTLPAAVAVATGPIVGFVIRRWATRTLGGVSGDVFGATNEITRVTALHAAVIAWHAGGGPIWTLL